MSVPHRWAAVFKHNAHARTGRVIVVTVMHPRRCRGLSLLKGLSDCATPRVIWHTRRTVFELRVCPTAAAHPYTSVCRTSFRCVFTFHSIFLLYISL